MYFRRKALAAALLLAQVATASTALAQQTTAPPRRPSGPAASPVIKLPPGSGASLEETQSNSSAKERAERAEPKRWEYCAITGVVWRQKGFSSSPRTPSALVRFFPNTVEEIEGSASEEDAIANAFTRLGDDGWELTGVASNFTLTDGNGKTASVYYFKRPKRTQPEQE